ncbi:antitoxin MazE family protein [Thalassospira sp.]|uniref:antitoxin MazE family protein n=1 Tax=Thalassospira sp. TaxID=1912094 RepID=UPI002736459E|nr:antitoxin MazE family protein [Thalassospira sp.]MDP2698932.1 antitoxin MazE family protein [Thalassospira sp.]
MVASVSERVKKHRAALRAAGLRPIQIWVPDTRRPGFAEECRRQCLVVAKAEAEDRDLADFMDAALADMDDEWQA